MPALDRPSPKLRVAILGHTAAPGGAELALLRLVEALDPDAVELTVILFSSGALTERLQAAGARVEVMPMGASATLDRAAAGATPWRAVRNAAGVLPFALRLGRRLRGLRPDVIHTTTLKADLLGVPASWIARRPLVWHVHDRISADYLPAPLVKLIRWLARWAPGRVIANSEATAATLPGVRDVVVAYPGLADSQMIASPADHRAPTVPVMGMLGRISPTKGQLVFVRAAALVLREHPGTRFRIVGEALFGEQAYAQQVRAEVAALGLDEAVEFVGFVDDPQSALDGFTACVHASPTPEPFGQVVAEAMGRGVPVIATEGGGIAEIVRPSPNTPPFGLLVPPGRPEALAAAMIDVLEHPDAAEERARRAWQRVREHFLVSSTAATVTEVWREVAAGRRSVRD